MSPVRVGVIGGGIAGPVAAMFLKQKGYEPTIYERTESPSDAGLGIGIQYNGRHVLNKIPGLLDYLGGIQIDGTYMYSVMPEDTAFLGATEHQKRQRETFGLGSVGFERPVIQRKLGEFAEKAGIPIKWGHKLESLEQTDDDVSVTFENGAKETFSFLVGCDGLHSNTRICLFGEEPADYTGISQWGGMSPVPEFWKGRHAIGEIFGNGEHMIVVPVSESMVIWAVSQRVPEAKETWKATDSATAEEFKRSSFSEWPFGAGEAIKSSVKVIRYGLYDRPELKTWHKGRVVLVGDAAHPTSPHLGQGANQSFEDIDLLIEMLEKHNPSTESPSTATLEAVFTEMEAVRIPRTAQMVKGARAHGDTRTLAGVDACLERNNFFRRLCKDLEMQKARWGV